jgi:hypothetical protein
VTLTFTTHPNPSLTPQGIRPNPTVGDINQYESSATMHMTQMFIGFNTRLNPNMSFSGSYVLGSQKSDSDGGFPINSYDLSGEWGRASSDIRHRFNLFGNYSAPKLWKLSFAPFLVINSGGQFNIVTGLILISIAWRTGGRPSQRSTPIARGADSHTFDYSRTDNVIIPRNYGNGPVRYQ